MYNWDDLRLFLAVARHKTYLGAAEATGLDATTLSRRVERLESVLKCTLIVRDRSGHALTAAGNQLLEAASQMELVNEALIDRIGTTSKAGRVRISTSEGFGTAILAPAVPQLMQEPPAVDIEIVANQGFLSPVIREVDLAVTLAAPQDRRLAVERLTEYELGLYASASYVATRGRPDDPSELRQHTLIGYIDDLLYANELRYLDEIAQDLRLSISSTSIRAQLEIVRTGAGIAVLPCFMAEAAKPRLVRILPRTARIFRTFWMSARRDVQQTTRVRKVRKWIRRTVSERERLLLPD
jgi:DNA-binding transcriptional LysR family regulator